MPTSKPEFRKKRLSQPPQPYRVNDQMREELAEITKKNSEDFFIVFEEEVNGYSLILKMLDTFAGHKEINETLRAMKRHFEIGANMLANIGSPVRVSIITAIMGDNYTHEQAEGFLAGEQRAQESLAYYIGCAIENRPTSKGGKQKDKNKFGLIYRLAQAYKRHIGPPSTSRDGPFERVVRLALKEAGTSPYSDIHNMIVKALNEITG